MTTWQPGDPLWIDHVHDGATLPMIDLIPEFWNGIGTSATWPEPGEWDLGEGDELAGFIDECKQMEGAA